HLDPTRRRLDLGVLARDRGIDDRDVARRRASHDHGCAVPELVPVMAVGAGERERHWVRIWGCRKLSVSRVGAFARFPAPCRWPRASPGPCYPTPPTPVPVWSHAR